MAAGARDVDGEPAHFAPHGMARRGGLDVRKIAGVVRAIPCAWSSSSRFAAAPSLESKAASHRDALVTTLDLAFFESQSCSGNEESEWIPH